MARTVSSTARQAGLAPETNEVFLYLLEISHTNLSTPIRVVNNRENIIHNGNTYLATAFNFTPPAESDGEIQPAKLTIDNVDRRIVEAIRTINSLADISAIVVLASDPDTIEVGPYEMILKNVSYNSETVSGDLIYLNYVLHNISTIVMNNKNFPGLIEWT